MQKAVRLAVIALGLVIFNFSGVVGQVYYTTSCSAIAITGSMSSRGAGSTIHGLPADGIGDNAVADKTNLPTIP